MASSSSDVKGKGMVEVDEKQSQQKYSPHSLVGGVVLSPNPIASYRPENSSQVEYAPHSKRVLKRSKKLFNSYVSFTLSEAEADYVRRMDEVTGGLPNAAGENTHPWVPMAVRLAGWTIETRQRFDSSKKVEQFFHHPRVSRVLRSKKHMVHYICYGSVPPPEKGKNKKSAEAEKEFVEAFLTESYNNLMNWVPS